VYHHYSEFKLFNNIPIVTMILEIPNRKYTNKVRILRIFLRNSPLSNYAKKATKVDFISFVKYATICNCKR